MGSNPTLTAMLFKINKICWLLASCLPALCHSSRPQATENTKVMHRGWRLNPHRLALHCVFRYLYLGLERAWVMSPKGPSPLQESCENIAGWMRHEFTLESDK